MSQPTLESSLAKHSINLPREQLEKLQAYCHSLWRWNERMNLTRHLDFETFVVRDVIDTMQLASRLDGSQRVLDVGSGGGVPGVPLAILRPDLHVSLCESSLKKSAALGSILDELGLSLPIYRDRVENVLTSQTFDSLVARAIGPMWKILKWIKPHWGAFERLLLIKGPKWTQERAEARHKGCFATLQLRRVASYHTPGHDGESVVLMIWPLNEESAHDRCTTSGDGTRPIVKP